MAETEVEHESSHESAGKKFSAFIKTPKGKVAVVAGFATLVGLYLYMKSRSAAAAAASTAATTASGTTSLTPSTVSSGAGTGYGSAGDQDSSDLSAIAQDLSGLQSQVTALTAAGTAAVPTASSGDTTDGANSSVSATNSVGAGASSIPVQAGSPAGSTAYNVTSSNGTTLPVTLDPGASIDAASLNALVNADAGDVSTRIL